MPQKRKIYFNLFITYFASQLVLEHDNSNASKRELFGTYMALNDYAMAQQKLSELQGINIENDNFVQLGNILFSLAQQNKTIYEIDSIDFAFVYNLAFECPKYDAVYDAQSIVYFITGEDIDECIDEIGNRSMQFSFNQNEVINEVNISLGENYPEPFNNYTTIPYNLPEETKGKIVVRDVLGKTVDVFEVMDTETEIKINTENWNANFYTYTLEVEGIKISNKKMILYK